MEGIFINFNICLYVAQETTPARNNSRTTTFAPLIDAKGHLFEFFFVSAKKRIIYEQVLQALLTVGSVTAKSSFTSSETCPLYGRFTSWSLGPSYISGNLSGQARIRQLLIPFNSFVHCVNWVFLGGLFRGNSFCFISREGTKHIFKAKWLMRETACQNFLRKNDKYPANARVVVGGGIFSINSVKCLVKNLIIKYSC